MEEKKRNKNKLTYYMRTIQNISEHLSKLDQLILTDFIPAITNGIICSETDRRLLSLPTKLGGLGNPIFAELAEIEYANSLMITKTLQANICNQTVQYDTEAANTTNMKIKIRKEKIQRNRAELSKINEQLDENQKRLILLNQENGASTWLTTLPLKDEGYILNKQQFWDLVRIRCT